MLPKTWLGRRDVSGDWRFRLAGEEINDLHRLSLAGKALCDILDPGSAAETVILCATGWILKESVTFTGERLLQPLMDATSGMAFVLGDPGQYRP